MTTKTAHMWKIVYQTPGGNEKYVYWRGKTATNAVNSWQGTGGQQWKIIEVSPYRFTYSV